jgi:hypothetical protein
VRRSCDIAARDGRESVCRDRRSSRWKCVARDSLLKDSVVSAGKSLMVE